jgi:uncharacterized protein YndB with AHSA1/START domain
VAQAKVGKLSAAQHEAPSLDIVRVFDAPKMLVYQMWSTPDHLRKWSAPKDYAIPAARTDFREGGSWYARMHTADGHDYRVQGTYREIIEGRRIVLTHAWLDRDGRPETETLITVTFEQQGTKTKMSFLQEGFDSVEARDGMAVGWNECFDLLGAHLAHFAGPPA